MAETKPIWCNISIERERGWCDLSSNYGVYAIMNSGWWEPTEHAYKMEECLYIGKSNNVRSRLSDHYRRFQYANPNKTKKLSNFGCGAKKIDRDGWETLMRDGHRAYKYFLPEGDTPGSIWAQIIHPPRGLTDIGKESWIAKTEKIYLHRYAKLFGRYPAGNRSY